MQLENDGRMYESRVRRSVLSGFKEWGKREITITIFDVLKVITNPLILAYPIKPWHKNMGCNA